MPIYEFRCDDCRKRTPVFVRSVAKTPESVSCKHCGSRAVARVFSRVAVLRRDDGAGFDEASLADVDENDPRSMARWVRKMSREMGEPLDAEMQSEIERMEAGEMPSGDNPEDDGDNGFDDVD